MRLEKMKNRPLDVDETMFRQAWLKDNRLWQKPMTFSEYQGYIESGEAVKTPSSHYYQDRSLNGLGNTIDETQSHLAHVELTLHTRFSYPVLHNHQYIELIYVAEGTVNNLMENAALDMKEGDVCILSPNSYHALLCTDDRSCILNIMIGKKFFDQNFLYVLSGGVIADFMEQILFARATSPYIFFPTGKDPWLHSLAQHMVTDKVQKKHCSDYSISLLTGDFLIHLSREYEALAAVPSAKNDQPNDFIVAVLSYLNVNYARTTLEKTAKFFGYSPAYLSRTIHENVGKTFSALMTEIQMKHAAQLLTDTELTITEIAQETGCFDSSHLSKKFRTLYGISPSDYRQRTQDERAPYLRA